jgi:5-methylcytosine-specific restriction endonuclease McrA
MSELVSTRLRQLVVKRANNQCEYCRLHEAVSPFSHEIDHLVARKHGGKRLPKIWLYPVCLVIAAKGLT